MPAPIPITPAHPNGPKRRYGRRRNVTGFTGVSQTQRRKYAARITRNGQRFNLGTFATAAEASAAYERAKTDPNLRPPCLRCNAIGLIGVRKHRGKFAARIGRNGQTICLGTFATAAEASAAYERARTEPNLSPPRRRRKVTNFVGVSMKDRRFEARIWRDGHQIQLGTFDTAEAAAAAYQQAKAAGGAAALLRQSGYVAWRAGKPR